MGGVILFGIPAAIIAGVKGFKPWRWLLAFGIIGLIVVISLSSAKAQGISAEESAARASTANSYGAVLVWVSVGLGVGLSIAGLLVQLAKS
jgi:hypothetical protein